ncbi:MAG: LemA family protein [Patescibacteria group bacterium]
MSDASKLAGVLNERLDTLHDPVVSEDPFSWSDSDKNRQDRTAIFRDISEKLTSFVYVPKTGTVIKILLFGTVLPLVLLAVCYLTETPTDEDMRLWVWGGLGVIAVIFAIVAAVVADDPDIDSDLSIFAVSENYPNLKASENFAKLQESLEETEDQVAAARRIYNANVNDYNTGVQQFPSNVVAGWFRFSEEPFFQTDQALDEAPKVTF